MLGTVNPVAEIARRAHEVGAVVVVDASQAVPQHAGRRAGVGVDFLAFTGHKVTGPTGIGVLWGRRASCSTQLPPFLGGGEMIATVTMERSTYAASRTSSRPAPRRSSRPSVSARPSTTSTELGMDNVRAHEQAVTGYALDGLATVDGADRARPAGRGAARRARSPSRSTASTRTT